MAKQLNAELENSWERATRIANWLEKRMTFRPTIGVVLGTGFGQLATALTNTQVIPYSQIPEFPISTVEGHAGNLIFGTVANGNRSTKVMLMQGRFHGYEGYSCHLTTLPIRVFKLLGVQQLLLTNAAGSVSKKVQAGDVMLFRSHINLPGLCGVNPLRGPNDSDRGPRFPSTADAYDVKLRQLLQLSLQDKSFPGAVHQGVYAFQMGPCFESVAEVKFLAALGADVVGMSTVPEAIVAHHCGIKVAAVSLVTNMCELDDSDEIIVTNHESVMEAAAQRSDYLREAVVDFLLRLET